MRPNKRNADGKRSELIAADWLFSQGCHVYMHVLEQGPIDLIALSPKGEILLFDVKTIARREDGSMISRTLGQSSESSASDFSMLIFLLTNVTFTPINLMLLVTQRSKLLIVGTAGRYLQPFPRFFTQCLRRQINLRPKSLNNMLIDRTL